MSDQNTTNSQDNTLETAESLNELIQLSLVHFTEADWHNCVFNADDLPADEDLPSKPVDRDFVADLSLRGIHTPISMAYLTDRNNMPFVIAGCRRIKGARKAKITDIPGRYAYMSTVDAIAMRSAENNRRSENSIADIEATKFYLNLYPEATIRQISVYSGIGQSRVKSLLKMAKMPMLFLNAIKEGFVSEETVRRLSTMPEKYIREAVQQYSQNEAEYLARKAKGEKPRSILFTNEDITKLQQVRTEEAVNEMAQGGLFDVEEPEGDNVFATLKTDYLDEAADALLNEVEQLRVPETVIGYSLAYTYDGAFQIHNYGQEWTDDLAAMVNVLEDFNANNPSITDACIVKLVKMG